MDISDISSPTPGSERRQHRRAVLRCPAQMLLPGAGPIEVRTVDISAGGMGIVAAVNPPSGVTCLLRMSIPLKPQGSAVIDVQAKVTHSVFGNSENGFKVGLQFTNLSESATSAIDKFLQASP